MAFGNRLVLVEFTKDTDKRAAGDLVKVDAASAACLCDIMQVAQRVDPTATAAPVTPEPVTVVDVEPEDTPPADVDD